MFTFKKSITAVAVAASLGLSLPALADDSKGFIAGESVTQSGQALNDVEVTITNLSTGLVRTVSSDESGGFKFPLLPPGTYSLLAKKAGYSAVQEKNLVVGPSGRTNISLEFETGDIERISVAGARISQIDVTSAEAQVVIDQEFLAKVPVPRDLASVALLAPGTTQGDADFGSQASFGGSSVGENAYYVNGLNVTNFRNGLGGSELPFEMYETFEVKTGGYSAEFGRSTGGVINTTTKSGSNEFHWGASGYYEPKALRSQSPDSILTDQEAIDLNGGKFYRVNKEDDVGETNVNVWASGALIEDKLFFFGLVNSKNRTNNSATSSQYFDREAGDILYAGKLDWYITPDHILEFTGWNNTEETEVSKLRYNPETEEVGALYGDYVQERGGKNYALQYTGILTDDVTISALYGVNKASYTDNNLGISEDTVAIIDDGSGVQFTDYGLTSVSIQNDKRTAYRFDVDWYVNSDHTIRAGIDYENLEAYEDTHRQGGVAYIYYNCDPDAIANGQLQGCDLVDENIYRNSGNFETKSNAYYIQDTWYITSDLVARLGLRNESFENYNKAGEKFVDISDQWAPRIGLSWDVNGDGDSKAFFNYGRYYLPVATNTNIRLAGDEYYVKTTYNVESINPDGTPVYGELDGTSVYADGTLKGTLETVNADIEPMYQEEYIIGYEAIVADGWSAGVKGTYRDLASSLEDIAIDAGFNRYLQDEFGSACTLCASGFHYYVLTNPGGPATITTDPDGDAGPLDYQEYTIPADYLGYPEAKRSYVGLDFTLNREFDGVWSMNAIYTWSHSYGNNEGYVRSDNAQDDAGLTTNFDQPGLTDGANGNLPQDRRHSVKVQGVYALNDNLSFGANFRWQSGRPISAFGYHPTDTYASLYDAESFAKDGQLVSRGSEGKTNNTWNLDLTARYVMQINDTDVTFRADVFNVFDNDEATEVQEVAERFAGYEVVDYDYGIIARGQASPFFKQDVYYQTPRSVRFSAEVKF